jgi:hypothetical protein
MSADPWRTLWSGGLGYRSHLHGRIMSAVVQSFALPGGDAP